MPATDAGWVTWTAATWADLMRARLETALGYTPDWTGLEGDWTAVTGVVAFTADQGFQIGTDTLNPQSASGSALDAAVAPIVERRPATHSRYTCTADDTSILPIGSLYQDPDGAVWEVVEGGSVTAGDEVVIEAQETGVVSLSQGAPTALTPITALVSPSDLTYTPADDYQVGRVVESDSALRYRWSVSLGRPRCPTGPGIRRTLREIIWVTATSALRVTPGVLAIYVVPEPVGADQEEELAEAIYSCVGVADLTTGTTSLVIAGADGEDVTISWTVGTTSAVTVAATLTLATGIALADVTDTVEDAIQGAFDVLEVGDTLYLLQVLGAISTVAGVNGASVLLNGVAGNVSPGVATTLITRGTTTIT